MIAPSKCMQIAHISSIHIQAKASSRQQVIPFCDIYIYIYTYMYTFSYVYVYTYIGTEGTAHIYKCICIGSIYINIPSGGKPRQRFERFETIVVFAIWKLLIHSPK
jgi:hypothetical protein